MKPIFSILVVLMCTTTVFAQKNVQRPSSYNFQRGVEALVDGDSETGLNYLNAELEENPKNGYAFAWIAAGRSADYEYGKALTAINKALKYLRKIYNILVGYTPCAAKSIWH